MKNFFTNVLASLLSAVRACTAWIRGGSKKDKPGYHVTRGGKLKYTGRYLNRTNILHKHQRLFGPPILTGERLRKVSKSCDPSNLIVQPRYRREVQ